MFICAAATASLAQTEAAAQRCANGGKAPTAAPKAVAAPPAFSAFFIVGHHLFEIGAATAFAGAKHPRIWAANTAGTRRRAWLSGFIDRDDRCASHASADAAPGSQPSGSGKAASSSQKLADEVLTKMQPHVRDHTLANNRWVPMHCAHMCNHCYTHRRAAPLMIRRLVVNQQRMTAPVLLPQPSRRSWNFRPPMQLTQARNLPCLCLQAH